jgi:hypothetical protein
MILLKKVLLKSHSQTLSQPALEGSSVCSGVGRPCDRLAFDLQSVLEQNKNNRENPATDAKVCVESGEGCGRALVRRDDPALGSINRGRRVDQ